MYPLEQLTGDIVNWPLHRRTRVHEEALIPVPAPPAREEEALLPLRLLEALLCRLYELLMPPAVLVPLEIVPRPPRLPLIIQEPIVVGTSCVSPLDGVRDGELSFWAIG